MKHEFGGQWTIQKLNILGQYLEYYSIALKNQPFNKIYIDAFAGNGKVFCSLDKDIQYEIDGSARIALQISNPFSQYKFVEINPDYIKDLENLKSEFPDRSNQISIMPGNANEQIKRICEETNWYKNRAVMFLDPYGMQIEWETIKIIAATGAIDLWYLFPISAVNRLLEKNAKIPQKLSERLDKTFGDNDWFDEFYKENPQIPLFDDMYTSQMTKNTNFYGIKNYIIKKLQTVFPAVANNPRMLYNTNNSPLFLFCFAVASKNISAQKVALKIAQHILKSNLAVQ